MASRIPSHQLSNGLYVSGRPNPQRHLNHPVPTLPPPVAGPFTVADAKNSGELAKKMLDTSFSTLSHHNPATFKPSLSSTSSSSCTLDQQNPLPLKPSRFSTSSSSRPNSNSFRSGPHSGPKKISGPMLQPTGLITSGPLGLSAGHQREPGSGAGKPVYGPAVTNMNDGQVRLGFRVSRAVMWVVLVAAAMVVLVGAFLMVAVERKDVMAMVMGGVLVAVVVVGVWNCGWKEKGLVGLLRSCPDDELRGAVDGQYAKVTGVVTCGSIPLESSFQKVPRCVYVSTELYEYRGWGGKTANPKHRFFSWGCRHVEKYVADFYVSDFQSGFRAQVKAGYGAKVALFVKPSTVVNITKENRDLSPSFLEWLTDRSLSSDDRIMRLEEGYIKEGSTVTVMGVVRRHGNALMIVPPGEPVSSGCQWARCLLPMYIEGLILTCDESQTTDVIPV